jgi:hypothetical protein
MEDVDADLDVRHFSSSIVETYELDTIINRNHTCNYNKTILIIAPRHIEGCSMGNGFLELNKGHVSEEGIMIPKY